ncbi:putative sulfate exporter family transporter, partial [uncultured Halomonas sp.]|uniref:putative sulfate exporter family transporter n=1 Tax=uncultured Halomonas sp. TaxID=173971 RepID=UPI00263493D7
MIIERGKRAMRSPIILSRATVERFPQVMPGVLICITIALATTFIADHYGGPTLLYALLFGMALHFLSEEGRCVAGIEFSSRTILRFGVALLGVRITVEQVTSLGIGPIVTAGLILQLLAGSSIIKADLSNPEDRGLFTSASKVFSIILTGVQAGAYILSGMYGSIDGITMLVILLQLLAAGIVV